MKCNTYFTVAQNQRKDLGKSNNKYQDYPKNPSEHIFFLQEVTPDEVCNLIQKLDIKNANDTYGIPLQLVKLSSDFIKGSLALIINDSFKEGIFPAKLKVGMVHPIHRLIQYTKVNLRCNALITG